MIKDAKTTCALVVGIERYNLGSDYDLPGAAVGAVEFIKWLLENGVDKDKIYFYCSPLDRRDLEDRLIGTEVIERGGGTFLHIRNGAFLGCLAQRKDCDTLIFYWAGHGFSTRRKGRVLYFADATRETPDCLRLDSVLDFLEIRTPHFRRQVGFVDACAIGATETKFNAQDLFQTEDDAYVTTRDLDRCFYFAAGIGRAASYPGNGESGAFTKLLLKILGQADLATSLHDLLQKNFPSNVGERLAYLDTRIGSTSNWSHFGVSASPETHRLLMESISLEEQASKLTKGLDAEIGKWIAAARRLLPSLREDVPTVAGIVRSFAQIANRQRAATYLTALILRMASVTPRARVKKVRADIARSTFGPHLVDAERLIGRIFQFAHPCYSILADLTYEGNIEKLMVRAVWFFSIAATEGERIATHVKDLEATLDGTITDHIRDNDVTPGDVLIELIAPLLVLCDPPKDALQIEKFYPLIFRWCDRTEGLGEFKRLSPFIRDYARSVKARTAGANVVTEWFYADDKAKEEIMARLQPDAQFPLDFPAFRTGSLSATEQQDRLKCLLRSGVPFAAFTRCSVSGLVCPDESDLNRCVMRAGRFSDLPKLIGEAARSKDGLLKHLSVLWDDFDRNPFLKYKSEI